MRILHTSDWHLGISLHGLSLLAEQDYFIEQLIKIAQDEQVDAVIVSGDIFDSSVSSGDAISLYNKAVTAICGGLKIPTFVIAGNHDGAARLAACNELLKTSGLYVSGRLPKRVEPVVIGNAAFYCVPYFNADETRALFPDVEIKNYEAAMLAVCDQIRLEMDADKTNIIVAHAYVSGAQISDSDKSAMLGTASMVSKDVFAGFSYVALGHLHRPQNVGANVRYSGSPLKYSFGEAAYGKSVTILDTADMSVTAREIRPLHEMRILKGEYDALLEGARRCDDFVKIEVTDRYVGLEALETFRSYFPNLLSVSGKSAVSENERMTLTIDEIETLSPTELLEKFFMDTLQYTPEKRQIEMFGAAFSEAADRREEFKGDVLP